MSIRKILLRILCVPITVLLLVLVFWRFFIIAEIPSESMEPTIKAESFAVYRRVSNAEKIELNDIVTFPHEGQMYVKRIVGMPGDIVEFSEGVMYRNGEAVDEYYLPIGTLTESNITVYNVPAGSCLVMGDNRSTSNDSRFWSYPYVPLESIAGVLIFHT